MSRAKKNQSYPDKVDVDGLVELISSLPDEVLLEIMSDFGMEPDEEREANAADDA